MKLNLETILATIKLVGAETEAYRRLFNQVKALFSETDQAKLQQTYDEAFADAEQAHREAQA